MNLPNKLTVLRIILVFVFMLFLFSQGVAAKVLALATFIAASATDFLDGYIAKKMKMVTDFGKLMDPIADKILVLAAFLAFVEMELIPAWMVVIIIFREVAITGLRLSALGRGKVVAADEGGKHKMVSQVFSIFAILLFLIFREAGIKVFDFWNSSTERVYKDTIFILMLITTLMTLISGISYFIKNKGVYFNAKNN
ncbi:MAG: CDP-diacylglycerol--glycerol-3-phosphate 3-phosphatidyltransferase [Candidatus Omnitrophota bacterium]|nr:CDP-diacylglycerol--glycerol-3-phosphate 3-phosphatidyltransferase [Candidatus Omnitrophota bacterium]